MVSGESSIVVSVEGEVEPVLGSHLLHHWLNAVPVVSHGLGGVVGVVTSAVPVFEELGRKRY